ncbi:MAG: methylmalonyl-CoA mutase family protein [Bacteroidia bacterium]
MQHLFTEFSPSTKQQWKEQIIKDLKGIDFNLLTWKTHNGLDIAPFYTPEDLHSPTPPLFAHQGWDICEQITVTDEAEANARALKALENGASGLAFYIHKKINTAALINGISLEHIYSQFFLSNDALHVLSDLKQVYGQVNPHDHKLKCFAHVDPLSLYAYYGEWHASLEQDLSVLKQLIHIPVNVSLYEEAGAGTVNELAIGLAHLNEHFNYLSEQNDLQTKQAVHTIFSVAPDFFTEIAKLRAWRKLIALLQQQYGIGLPVHLHVQTAQIDKSSMDAYTNMLRTTTEAMSAVIGGADSICVLPYNEMYEKATDFSSRIALNQQHVLKNESYLDKVSDIAAGSYYIESLTDSIAEKAWEQFKMIESKGGFIACMKSGFIQDLIAADAAVLQQEVKENKLILVGVNKFQNLKEVIKPLAGSKPSGRKTEIRPIQPIRLAEAFERAAMNSELSTPN